MSVESEILRIQHNIADAYAAVADKGGEVPLQPTSANLAAAVASIPAGDPSGDGCPIGTVISYLGTTAPQNYLVCDGAAYNISAYPALASFFETQFGAKNYFGGNGTTTFAVPDLRNLFLRGYHGGAKEQLSGEVGVKQEATRHIRMTADANDALVLYGRGNSRNISHEDSPVGVSSSLSSFGRVNSSTTNVGSPFYTSRPVNMAVLYCLKAVESAP